MGGAYPRAAASADSEAVRRLSGTGLRLNSLISRSRLLITCANVMGKLWRVNLVTGTEAVACRV